MRIIDPIQINDYNIKKFLIIIVSIHLAILGLVGSDIIIGLNIPILRQLMGFIYLTFIPGIVIMRIMRLHEIGTVRTLLFSIGLSMSFLMFVGLLINLIYPIIGISKPISIIPLILTIISIVLLLSLLAYVTDSNYSSFKQIEIKNINTVLSLFLLPILSILGTYLVNFYNNNIILIFILIIIGMVPILVMFNKISNNYYALIIVLISISLLYHRSLISSYLWGWDIHNEYYMSNSVFKNSIWDPTINTNVNAILSITILPSIYSIISDISIISVLKIIYPLIFSLVPLGLYGIYKEQTNDKIAFLSVFFFMSIFTFYGELPILPRQEIAEVFLILLVMLSMSKDIKISFLLIVFDLSLITSHYGLSYIFMFNLLLAFFILTYSNLSHLKNDNYKNITNPESVVIYLVLVITWYMYVSSSSVFITVLKIGDNIVSNLYNDFMSPDTVEGLNIVTMGTTSISYTVLKYLHMITIILIFIGIIGLILNYKYSKFTREYIAFSIINFGILVGATTIPYFAGSITMTRMYHITSIILAPFSILGGIYLFKNLKKISVSWDIDRSLKILSIFFMIFFSFNSGLINELVNDHPFSISLNVTLDYPRFNDREVFGAKWLSYNMKPGEIVYADVFGEALLRGFVFPQWLAQIFFSSTDTISEFDRPFVYLRNLNINGKFMRPAEKRTFERPYDYEDIQKSVFYNKILIYKNKLYDNGGSEIWRGL